MKTRAEIECFLSEIRHFQDYDFAYDISPQLTDSINFVSKSNNQEDFVILLYGLDDKTGCFEFSQSIIENIHGFYFERDKNSFLKIFMENIEIIYPHAIEMTKYVLNPIFNEREALEIVCNLLDNISTNKKMIFREIYLQMIQENRSFDSKCIHSKLTQMM